MILRISLNFMKGTLACHRGRSGGCVAPLSPFYWGTSGYTDLIRGGGMGDVLTNVAVLGVFGVTLLLLGARFLEARVRTGAA